MLRTTPDKKPTTVTNRDASPPRGVVKNNPNYERIRNSISADVAAAPVGLAHQLERGASDRLRW